MKRVRAGFTQGVLFVAVEVQKAGVDEAGRQLALELFNTLESLRAEEVFAAELRFRGAGGRADAAPGAVGIVDG